VPCDAHGGLTYKDACREDICHKGNGDEVQWIGFDCAHAGDLVPGVSAAYGFLPPGFMGDWMRDDTYRTASWVRDECARIAKQARDAAQA
jgi:hypothetical protein